MGQAKRSRFLGKGLVLGCFYQVPPFGAEFGSSVEPPLPSEVGSLSLAPRSLISGAEVLASVDQHLELVDRALNSVDHSPGVSGSSAASVEDPLN
jgi:hypothetical protein